jgi:two-component system sensor histidine kinase HydH
VALVDDDGRIARSAGTAIGTADPISDAPDGRRGPEITRVGSRVRAAIVRGPRPPLPPREMGGEPGSPSPQSGPERPRGTIVEFEPVKANDLVRRAARLQAFGVAAAVVMMFAAAVSWRSSRRYDSAMRRLEQERRLSLLGEMTAVLAHEIRNPLASLKGNAQLLSERLPCESMERRKADFVVEEACRLEALTTDLLDFARTGPIDARPVDPAELARGAAADVDPHGFDLDLDGAPERWLLDERRMRQVLTNVLRNARQTSLPGAAHPLIRVMAEAGALHFVIRDHGAGLPAGDEGRIFDPFFTTRTSGTGLGLAVARRIVELHGGRITAENHPEGGAVFAIRIPRMGGA